MIKTLKVKFPQKCIGCELCVQEVQRQLGKIGIEGSFIRIFRKKDARSKFLEYSLDLDPQVNNMDINKIVDICPTQVFDIEEVKENEPRS